MHALYKILFSLIWLTVSSGATFDAKAGERFVKTKNGVVADHELGLEWIAGPDKPIGWEAARLWADRLEKAGGGWRMPTKKELSTLKAIGDGVYNINPNFPTSGYWIWAGNKLGARWLFGFSYGGEGWSGEPPPDGGRAFAVRER